MKKKLYYTGAITLSLVLGVLFGLVLPNRALLSVPRAWDVNWFHAFLAIAATIALASFFIEAVCDRKEFAKDIRALGRYRFLLFDLVSRDIKTKYRRSVLGILWSVLNPLLMMLVLNVIFIHVMRVQVSDPGGFPLFYLTGYLLFVFLQESTSVSMQSVFSAAPLIKKVYLPKYIFPLEKCIFSLVNLLFSLIAFVIVFIFYAVADPLVTPHLTMLLFPLPVIYLFVFALGLSLILSAAYIFFRDIAHIYGIFLTVWMYASPIIYPKSYLGARLSSLMNFNPLFHYIEYFRDVMIRGEIPGLYENLICLLFSLSFLAIGITVFRKAQDKFVLFI